MVTMNNLNRMNQVNFQANNKNNSPYAHIIKENPLQQVASSVQTHASNFSNIGKAIMKGEGTDYTLGRMNDTTLRMGSLGIATLASAKSLSTISGVGEFLGFCMWFVSMGISPKIVNKMVQVKYGLDLDKEYVDSYGRRNKLFSDPGFICWDLIPDEELNRIGDRMGVPKNIVNRKEAIQEKITQVVVQSKTWVMVSAGVATPVIASLLGDALRKPTDKFFGWLHSKTMSNLESSIKSALDSGNTQKAQQLLKKAVQKTYGNSDATAMARIWKNAPDEVVKKSGLIDGAVKRLGEMMQKAKKALSGEKAWIGKTSHSASAAANAKKLTAIIEHLQANPDKAKEGMQVLEQHIQTAKGWKELLMKYEHLMDNATKEMIRVKTISLESGFGSMAKVLAEAAKGNADPKTLQTLLRGINDAQAQRRTVEQLAKFLGEDVAKEVKSLIGKGQTEKAIDLISKRPFKFVDDGVKEVLLHKRWLKRIGVIGIGLVAATALYVFFFMGNSNKYNPRIKEN